MTNPPTPAPRRLLRQASYHSSYTTSWEMTSTSPYERPSIRMRKDDPGCISICLPGEQSDPRSDLSSPHLHQLTTLNSPTGGDRANLVLVQTGEVSRVRFAE